jgi:cytochrome c5
MTDRTAGCSGKEAFVKWEDAERAARRKRRSGGKVHAYRCDLCHAVHIGSVGGEVDRAKRRAFIRAMWKAWKEPE